MANDYTDYAVGPVHFWDDLRAAIQATTAEDLLTHGPDGVALAWAILASEGPLLWRDLAEQAGMSAPRAWDITREWIHTFRRLGGTRTY